MLVDLTTDALINRLNRGVVYDLDKIPGALSNFFRRGNLVALRELALRKTAEEVDETLQDYIDEHEIETPWATEERVVVCVKAGPVAAKLVRRGYRLAKRLKGHFWVVHVHTPGEALGRHHDELAELFELAREPRRQRRRALRRLRSRRDPKFAREHRATFIVLGQSRRSRMRGGPAGLVADRAHHARDRAHGRAGGRRPEQGRRDLTELTVRRPVRT